MVRVINPPAYLGILSNPRRRKRRKSSGSKSRRARRASRRRSSARRSSSGRFLKKRSTRRRKSISRKARRASRRPRKNRSTRRHIMARKRKSSRRRARRNPGGALAIVPASFRSLTRPQTWMADAIPVGAGLVLPNLAIAAARRFAPQFVPVPTTRLGSYAMKAAAVGVVAAIAAKTTKPETARKVLVGGMASIVLDAYADFIAPMLAGMMGGSGMGAWYGPDLGAWYGPNLGYEGGSAEGAEEMDMDEVSYEDDVALPAE